MFEQPTRNHFTIIIERLGAIGVAALSMVYYVLFNNKSDYSFFQKEYWLDMWYSLSSADTFFATLVRLAIAAAALVALVFLIIRWSKTYFYLQDGYLVFEKRTLMKKNSRLPVSGIATVNLERTVFERIVGTARIKLDINSSVTANATDFTFVLTLEKARAFEKALLEIKNGGEDFSSQQAEPLRETVCAFNRARAVRHVLCSQPLLQILFSVGAFFSTYLMGEKININVVFSVAIVAVAGWLAKVIFQIMAACDFKVERDENSLYISSGLLNKKSYSFEFEKISALSVKQPLLARIFRLYSAEVAVIGLGNDKKETPQICLLVNRGELEKLLKVCASAFECKGVEEKSHISGLYMGLLRWLLVAVVPCVALFVKLGPVYALLTAAAAVGCAVLSWRTKSLCADDNVFGYSQGIFSKRIVRFRYRDIQTAEFTTNFIVNRKAGRIRISILAGSAMALHTTGWFTQQRFEQLAQRFDV